MKLFNSDQMGYLAMHFKKTVLLTVCSFALLGCAPKTKIESGTTITATVWDISSTILAKNVILSADKSAQEKLRNMKCEIALNPTFNTTTSRHEAATATFACDKGDVVTFSIELMGPDGKPGLTGIAVGETITMKLTEQVSI